MKHQHSDFKLDLANLRAPAAVDQAVAKNMELIAQSYSKDLVANARPIKERDATTIMTKCYH